MGSSLIRDFHHNDNTTGNTIIDHPVSTLTLGGSLDGVFRITRNAEAFYHHVQNVHETQVGKFPVIMLKGLSHRSFFDSKYISQHIKANDLDPTVSQEDGFALVAGVFVEFIKQIEEK